MNPAVPLTIFYGLCLMNFLFFTATQCANVFVSNEAKANEDKKCGTEDNPCSTITAGVENAEEYSQITIIPTGTPYKECPIYVHIPLAFMGFHEKPIIDCDGKDALIFNLDPKAEKIKEKKVIKLEISNLQIRNSKTAFSFSKPTKNVNLRLKNIEFVDNQIDVSWSNSQLCYLVMTNVLASGRWGNVIEVEGCNKTDIQLTNTKFLGKYFQAISTEKSSFLSISMSGVEFDMSGRTLKADLSIDSTKDDALSPMRVIAALERTTITITTSTFSNHFSERKSMIEFTAFQTTVEKANKLHKRKRNRFISPININFHAVRFENNTVKNGGGGAISFNLTNFLTKKKPHIIQIYGCTFAGNSATNGGALWFSNWEKRKVLFNGSAFINNRALGTKDSSGGALFGLAGKFQVKFCKFEGNTATKYGGALYLSNKKTTSIRVYSSVFENKKHSWSNIEGAVMYLDDVQTMFYDKVVFNLSSGNSGESIFLYEGRPSTFIMSNQSVFICPPGYNYEESRLTLKLTQTPPRYFPTYHMFAFSCKPCQDLFYGTTRGFRQANLTATRGKCHACPYGASCNGTIRARANFWGRLVGDKIEMIPCPKGYCCNREPCESYDSCRSHRTGTLCGHCPDGYTEGMSSTDCYPNEKCDERWWTWPVFNVVAIFVVLSFHQEIIKKLVKWSLWANEDDDNAEGKEYRRNESNQNTRNTEALESATESTNASNVSIEVINRQPDYTHIEKSSHYNNSGGYIKVFYYFYQAVFLIRHSSYVSSSVFPNSVIALLSPLLNFQFTNIWNCAGENLNPVKKVLLKNSVAYWVFGFSLILYLCYACLKKCRRIDIDDAPAFKVKSFPVRLVGTCIHVILLSYISQTQLVVQLLHCVEVGDQNVLYIDGSVSCYESYQKFFWFYFVICIASFPFALCFGLHLLTYRKISWKKFMLACFIPLPFLGYWAYKQYKHSKGITPWPELPKTDDQPFRDKIAYIVQYPYKSPEYPNAPSVIERCRENWEAVLMLRRLILVLVFIFVKSFLLRAYLFFLSSILFLLAHVFVQPFNNKTVNNLDTISLSVIVLISGLNIAEASYNNAGQLLPYDIEMLQSLQDWILALLPFVLVSIFLFPRIKKLIFRRKTRPERQPLPTDDPSDEVVTNPTIGMLPNEDSSHSTPLAVQMTGYNTVS